MILPNHQQGIFVSFAFQKPTTHFSTAGGIISYMGNSDEVETRKNNELQGAISGIWSSNERIVEQI